MEQSASFYYLQGNGEIEKQNYSKVEDAYSWDINSPNFNNLPDSARTQRIDSVDTLVNNLPPEIMIVGGLHADEEKAPELAKDVFKDLPFSHTFVPFAHRLAGMLGLRSWIRPLSDNEDFNKLPDMEKALLRTREKEDKSTIGVQTMDYDDNLHKPKVDVFNHDKESEQVFGARIDLNRQFGNIPDSAKSLDDVVAVTKNEEAKLLIRYFQDHPQTKAVFTIHEEPDMGLKDEISGDDQFKLNKDDGLYFYYQTKDTVTNDPWLALINLLRDKLVKRLQAEGFVIFAGVDDPNDPDLNFPVSEGMIYQPAEITENGLAKFDKTFEGFLTASAARGLKIRDGSAESVQVQHAFAFEIPKYLSLDRKELMLKIIKEEFIMPYVSNVTTSSKQP